MNENLLFECVSGFQNILMDIINAFADLSSGESYDGLSDDTDYPYMYQKSYYDYGLEEVRERDDSSSEYSDKGSSEYSGGNSEYNGGESDIGYEEDEEDNGFYLL